jgi:hypothetical protein
LSLGHSPADEACATAKLRDRSFAGFVLGHPFNDAASNRPRPIHFHKSFAWRTTGSAVVGAALYHAGQFGSSPCVWKI